MLLQPAHVGGTLEEPQQLIGQPLEEQNLREFEDENLTRRADFKEQDELARERVDIRSRCAILELLEEVKARLQVVDVAAGKLVDHQARWDWRIPHRSACRICSSSIRR